MADAREARLPKWAQEELASLRRNLESARKRVAELSGSVGDTNTYHDDYIHGACALPNNARVMFRIGKHRSDEVSCYVENGMLTMQGNSSVELLPLASNLLTIRIRERW